VIVSRPSTTAKSSPTTVIAPSRPQQRPPESRLTLPIRVRRTPSQTTRRPFREQTPGGILSTLNTHQESNQTQPDRRRNTEIEYPLPTRASSGPETSSSTASKPNTHLLLIRRDPLPDHRRANFPWRTISTPVKVERIAERRDTTYDRLRASSRATD